MDLIIFNLDFYRRGCKMKSIYIKFDEQNRQEIESEKEKTDYGWEGFLMAMVRCWKKNGGK